MEEQLKVIHIHKKWSLFHFLLIKTKLWQTWREMINSQMVSVCEVSAEPRWSLLRLRRLRLTSFVTIMLRWLRNVPALWRSSEWAIGVHLHSQMSAVLCPRGYKQKPVVICEWEVYTNTGCRSENRSDRGPTVRCLNGRVCSGRVCVSLSVRARLLDLFYCNKLHKLIV